MSVKDIFTDSELIVILEVAKEALNDPLLFEMVAEDLDISDEEMLGVQVLVQEALR